MSTNTPRLNLLKPDPIESMADVDTWLNDNMDNLDTNAGLRILSDVASLPVSPFVGQLVFIGTAASLNTNKGAILQWNGTEWRHRGKKGAGFGREANNYSCPNGTSTVSFTTTESVAFTATSNTVMTCLIGGLYLFSWEARWADYDRTLSFEKLSGIWITRGGTDIFTSADGNALQETASAGTTTYGHCGSTVYPLQVGDTVRMLQFNSSSAKTIVRARLSAQVFGTEVTYTTPG